MVYPNRMVGVLGNSFEVLLPMVCHSIIWANNRKKSHPTRVVMRT